MKRIILFFLLLPFIGHTTDYYVDNAGSDGNAGTSTGAAWATLTKVNSFAFAAGDHLFFKRSGVWYGQLIWTRSGTVGNPIVIDAYGTGADPIITGLSDITSWTSLGSNLWQSTSAIGSLSQCNMVLVNGFFTPIGKWPNGNKVYNTINSSVGTTSLTSTSISGAINYVGATVAIRKQHWIIDRYPILTQSGSTINFNSLYDAGTPPIYNIQNNWGFFIQNSQVVCDQQNEWWYDAVSKKLGIFSTISPVNIKASTIDIVVSMSNQSYVTFNNIQFQGGNLKTIQATGAANNIVFNSCTWLYAGVDGVYLNPAAHHFTFDNCYADYTNSVFFNCQNAQNITFTNNTVRRTGTIAGMGQSRDGTYTAVYYAGANSLFQYNKIVQTGGTGIDFRAGNIQILNNLVDTFDLCKDDLGGIYCFTGATTTVYTQRIVDHNIVLNGGGASAGTALGNTNSDAFAFYMDDNSSQVTLSNNTAANCGSSGLFLHASHSITATNNTFYNNVTTGSYGQILQVYPGAVATADVRNLIFTGNRIVSKQTTQILGYFRYVKTGESNMSQWSIPASNWNNNYWARPINDATAVNTFVAITNAGTVATDLVGWRTASGGLDATSVKSPVQITNVNDIRFDYNATNSPVSINLAGITYKNVTGANFSGSYNLAAWSSEVLIKTGTGGNIPPTANAGPNQTITSPTSSVTLSGSGSDADGTITAYQWTKISGPSATITSPTTASTGVTGLSAGVYIFQLQVTDNGSLTATNTVQVTVNAAPPVNQPPVADAGIDKVITSPANSVLQVGSGTDADGTVASYLWTKIAGPTTFNIVTPTTSTTTINNLVIGAYQFQLLVTDNLGATDVDVVNVTVNNPTPNSPPSVNAGVDISMTLPTNSAVMAATITDADGTIATISWTKTSGPGTFTISNPSIEDPTISNLVAGVYQFQVTGVDNLGASVSDVVQITVIASNIPPSANAGADQTLPLGTTTATISGSGIDADGFVASYGWTQVSGPNTASITSASSASTGLTGLISGTYEFQLTTTDNVGGTGTDNVRIVIIGPPPSNLFQIKIFKYGLHTDGSGIDFDWAVVGDQDIIRYEIEQSTDGKTFSKYSTTQAAARTYSYTYPSKTICVRQWWMFCTQKKTVYVQTHLYWRLKAVDKNLTGYYSDIKKT